MEQEDKRFPIMINRDGYICNKEIGFAREDIPFGGIVCLVLNKYYGIPECRKSNTGFQLTYLAELRKVAQPGLRLAATFTPIIEKLPKLVTDRDGFVAFMNDTSKRKYLSPPTVLVKQTWSAATSSGEQEIFVKGIDDLLIYDISEVLKQNISIKQCYCGKYFVASRKNQVYCPEHKQAGANKTRLEKRKTDRCTELSDRIKSRLYMRTQRPCDSPEKDIEATQVYENFKCERKTWKAAYKAGEITESEYYDLLCGAAEKYLLYRRKK